MVCSSGRMEGREVESFLKEQDERLLFECQTCVGLQEIGQKKRVQYAISWSWFNCKFQQMGVGEVATLMFNFPHTPG